MANSIASAFGWVVVSKAVVVIAGFSFTPVLVRLIGPTAYGQYALFLSMYGIVNLVIIGGTSDALRKYISERDDPAWQTAVYGYLLGPTLLLGTLTGLGFMFAAWTGLAAALFGEAFTSLFYLLGVYAIVSQLAFHNLRALMGLRLESKSEPLKIIQKLLFVSLGLGLVVLGFGVEGVVVAHIVASGAVFVVGAYFLGQVLEAGLLRSWLSSLRVRPFKYGSFGSDRNFGPDLGPENGDSLELPKRRMIGYIGSTVVFFLFLNSLYYVDVIFLQYWSTDETVGYYQGALSIAEFLWFAPLAVQLVLLQRVSDRWEKGQLEAIQRQASLVTRYVLLFTALVAIGMAALAADFVPLYLGSAFTPSVTPLLLLLPGVIGFAVARPTLAINQGRRSLRPLLIATGACSLVNLAGNLLLIPLYGMIGAAVATSIGYASLVVFQSMAARHLGYDPLAGLRPVPTLATIGVAGGVIFAVSTAISSSILALLMVPPVGAVVYVSVAIALGAVTQEEIDTAVSGVGLLPTSIERRIFTLLEAIPKLNK